MDFFNGRGPFLFGLQCNGFAYTIKQGDTLYALGKKYNVPVADIIRANPFINVYNLRIGMEICIPTGEDSTITPREIPEEISREITRVMPPQAQPAPQEPQFREPQFQMPQFQMPQPQMPMQTPQMNNNIRMNNVRGMTNRDINSKVESNKQKNALDSFKAFNTLYNNRMGKDFFNKEDNVD